MRHHAHREGVVRGSSGNNTSNNRLRIQHSHTTADTLPQNSPSDHQCFPITRRHAFLFLLLFRQGGGEPGVGEGTGEGCGDGTGGTGRGAGGCGLGKVGPGPGCGGSPVTSIVVGTVPARTPTNPTLKIKPNVSFMVWRDLTMFPSFSRLGKPPITGGSLPSSFMRQRPSFRGRVGRNGGKQQRTLRRVDGEAHGVRTFRRNDRKYQRRPGAACPPKKKADSSIALTARRCRHSPGRV